MTTEAGDRLYSLLPAVHRQRDAAEGYPLRALLDIMGRELGALEGDIDALYDNWFIETCEEWVVPYIGDLLGVRGLSDVSGRVFSQRARVAGTIAYRRRKGTAAMLEQLARDVTGWPARAVEFFERLATTQHLNHVRLNAPATASLRNATELELVGGPLEKVAYTAEVRHIDVARGRYNIPNVGLFLWRLQSYPLTRSSARLVQPAALGGRTFDPFGLDVPLYNQPETEDEVSHLAEEIDLPGPLRRRVLASELRALRTAIEKGTAVRGEYFDVSPVLSVFLDGADQPLPPEELIICNLDPWHRPLAKEVERKDGTTFTPRVAVDPARGRLAIPSNAALPESVEVSYAYAFAGDLGGGPYDRRESFEAWLNTVDGAERITWKMGVTKAPALGDPLLVSTLADAVAAWNSQPQGTVGVIAIMDNLSYDAAIAGVNAIAIPEGSHLLIVAAEWPAPETLGAVRLLNKLLPANRRPHVLGDIEIIGTALVESRTPGSFTLDGVLLEGTLTVRSGQLGALRVAHCTLPPRTQSGARGKLVVKPGNERLEVTVERSICGDVAVHATARALRIVDSIIDGAVGDALTGPATSVQRSTVLGRTVVRSLDASDSIFTERVVAERRQVGCVRFSYLPTSSLAPRRYRCQPSGTGAGRAVRPQFTSVGFGEPAYAGLDVSCPAAIATGASDEGEMGAFNFLRSAQRVKNLRASLDEFLRVGLEAGLFFAT